MVAALDNEIAPESPEAALKRAAADASAIDGEAFRFGRPPDDLPLLEPAPATRVTSAAGVQVERLDLARARDRARFIAVAAPIYAGDPHYVAPLSGPLKKFLDPAKNPSLRHIEVLPLVVVRDGRDVGRMTAHIDRRYNEYHLSQTGFFGFFECRDDRAAAHAMLAEATAWLAAQGMDEVFGPMSFTTNHIAGLLVENFDRPPFVEQAYNPSYYEALLTSFGFGKAKDLFAWWIDIAEGMETKNRSRVARIAERVKKREGVTIRPVNPSDVAGEIERLFGLYNAAWQKNWGFVPLTREEFEHIAEDIQDVLVPELVMFVELDGKAVGFTATIPNVNDVLPKDGRLFPFGWTKLIGWRKRMTRARLYTLGMLPEFRKRGLETLMFTETVNRAQKLGYTGGEVGWTLEDNDLINRAIETMDGRLDRRYRVLGMRLRDGGGAAR